MSIAQGLEDHSIDTPICNDKTFILYKPFLKSHLFCVCVCVCTLARKVHVWSSEDNFSTMLVLRIKFRSLEWQVSLPTEQFCKLSDKSRKMLTLVLPLCSRTVEGTSITSFSIF